MIQQQKEKGKQRITVAVWNRKQAGGSTGEQEDFKLHLKKSLEKIFSDREEEKLVVFPPYFFQSSPEAVPRLSVNQILTSCCDLARQLQVNLIPGSFLVQEKEGLFHQAHFIDKRGKVTGYCCQTHLTPEEVGAGWQMAMELPLVDTPLGQVAIMLNRDCWQPEVWRMVTLAGADLVVGLTMVPAPYSESKQLAGIWQNIQQNQVLGLECCGQGQWQGQAYQGRSGFFAPCEMTPGFTGKLAGEEEAGFLVCSLDFARLEQVRREYPLLEQLNIPMYQKKLLSLYPGWHKGVEGE